jgi:hypothetical protein
MNERPGVKLVEGARIAFWLVEKNHLDELYRHRCKYGTRGIHTEIHLLKSSPAPQLRTGRVFVR